MENVDVHDVRDRLRVAIALTIICPRFGSAQYGLHTIEELEQLCCFYHDILSFEEIESYIEAEKQEDLEMCVNHDYFSRIQDVFFSNNIKGDSV